MRGRSVYMEEAKRVTVVDLGGVSPPPPHGPKFSQFHAIFLENLVKSYVGALHPPPPPGILDPPLCRLGLFVLRDEATIRSHGGCETQKQHKSILSKFGSLLTRLNMIVHQGKFNKTQVALPIKNRSLTEHSFLPEGNVGSIGRGGLRGSRNEIDRVLHIYVTGLRLL